MRTEAISALPAQSSATLQGISQKLWNRGLHGYVSSGHTVLDQTLTSLLECRASLINIVVDGLQRLP